MGKALETPPELEGFVTPLQAARATLGFRSRPCANAMGIDPSGFARIESATFTASRETAAVIFEFFGGTIELGLIYDPLHPVYASYLTPSRIRRLQARGRALYRRYPVLRHDRALLAPESFQRPKTAKNA